MEQLRARLIGAIAAVLTLAAIMVTLFTAPSVGAVPTGTYRAVETQLRLEAVDAADGASAETYRMEPYDPAFVLRAGQRSIVWAALPARLLCLLFGGYFGTPVLASVYALILSLAAYLTASGLYRRSPLAGSFAAGTFPILLLHPGITGYLNSLYDIGSEITFTLLFVGVLIHALCLPRRCGTRYLIGYAVSATLMLCAGALQLVFVPAVAAGFVCVYLHCRPEGGRRAKHAVLALISVLLCVVYTGSAFTADPDLMSDAASYLAVFQGYLPASEDAAGDLEALGLDAELIGDIGRSYYDPEESFVRSPRGEDAAFLSRITLSRRIGFLLSRPGLVSAMTEAESARLADVYNGLLVDANGSVLNDRVSAYTVLETIFGAGGLHTLLLRFAAAAVVLLLLLLICGRGGARVLCLCLLLMMGGAALLLPADAVLTGGQLTDRIKVLAQLLSWLAILLCIGGIAEAGTRVATWLSERDTSLWEPVPEPEPRRRATAARRPIPRAVLLWGVALLSVAICCALLLPEKHAGGINNGDYGRMMDQLDITWAEAQQLEPSTQAGTQVVETYDYCDTFHAERLTSADPTYSLLFASMPVRLISRITGSPFSTRTLAFVLLALTIASLTLLVSDLYGLLGGLAVLPALLLVCMLFGESYVAWYDSLFGESSISTGLIATIACALHLCLLRREGKRRWVWLLLLGAALRFLCCAKAQMAVALPFALAILIALAVYRRPKARRQAIAWLCLAALLCGLISWDTVGVYQKNRGVSEKQTIWQSVFYGALMISEDPEATMEELGIPAEMAADIGKHAYYPDEDYVYAPTSPEAQEKLYDHVTTMTMVRYYLRHPVYLLRMLDRAAGESVSLHTGFMAYTDERYADSKGLYRFNLWACVRTLFACRRFWQELAVYGIVLFLALRYMLDRRRRGERRLAVFIALCILGIGVLQFPLSVIGNGFADNNKQMYCFMLTYDMMIIGLVTLLTARLRARSAQQGPERKEGDA